jgi:hypothetical protein
MHLLGFGPRLPSSVSTVSQTAVCETTPANIQRGLFLVSKAISKLLRSREVLGRSETLCWPPAPIGPGSLRQQLHLTTTRSDPGAQRLSLAAYQSPRVHQAASRRDLDGLLPREPGQACRLAWTVVRARRYLHMHASALAHEGPADHDVMLLRQVLGLADRRLLPVTIELRRRGRGGVHVFQRLGVADAAESEIVSQAKRQSRQWVKDEAHA